MSGLSTIFKMAVKAAAAPNKKLLDMKYTRETPKTKEGFSSVDLASEGKITDQEAIGGLFNPISFNKGGMKVGPDASNLNTSRIEISTFNPTSTPGPLGFGMKAADDIGLPSTAVGNKTKDAIKVQTNLIEGSKWKWEGKVPKGFENNTHLVSMQGGSKLKKASGGPTDHSYATKVIYEKGGNLSTYDTRAKYVKELHKSIPESLAALKIKIPKEVEKLTKELKAKGKSTEEIKKRVNVLKKKLTRDYKGDNPKGKPTTVGVPEFGTKIGEIKKGGIIQPVYDQIIMKEEGGQIMPMQYGGGLSNAYSTLSERRQNQNMYGMGDAPMQQMPSQMSSAFQDPMEASAFSPVNMEHGGDIVVPKERMINDQPHELSYINPQEAGLLKALGGSGRRVDGIPAYFSDDGLGDGSEDDGSPSSSDGNDGNYNYEFNEQGGYDYSRDLDPDRGTSSGLPTDTGYTGQGGTPTVSDYLTGIYGQEIGNQLASGPIGTLGNVRSLTRSKDGRDFLREADAGLGRENFAIDKGTIQRGIDKGLYRGAGIALANELEEGGLATFGKDMRGPFEAYTPGKAVYRNLGDKGQAESGRGEYDPEALVGNADLSNNPNKAAIQAFNNGIRYAKSGETIEDVTQNMKDSGRFSTEEISNAAATMGFSTNSSAQASQVYNAFNDARIDGAISGGLLVGGMLTNPTGLISNLSSSFDAEGKTRNMYSDLTDKVGEVTDKVTDFAKGLIGLTPEEKEEASTSSLFDNKSEEINFKDGRIQDLDPLDQADKDLEIAEEQSREEGKSNFSVGDSLSLLNDPIGFFAGKTNPDRTNIDDTPFTSSRQVREDAPENLKQQSFKNFEDNVTDYKARMDKAKEVVNNYNAYAKAVEKYKNPYERTKYFAQVNALQPPERDPYNTFINSLNDIYKNSTDITEFISSSGKVPYAPIENLSIEDLGSIDMLEEGKLGKFGDLSIKSGAMDVDQVPEGELSRENLIDLFDDPEQNPEQNIFERGIGAVVDLFGGPEAAYRNNLDTSFGSGNDQPERRVAPPPKIPEVLSAAIEQAEPIPVEDSGLSARELSLGPQVNTLILQGVDPSTAVRQVGIDQGDFTVAQILKLLGVS